MNKFTIPTKDLEALSIGMSSEETRYYLKGVNVKCVALGYRLAATDGHLLLCNMVYENTETHNECNVIMCADFVKNALKIAKSMKLTSVDIEISDGQSRLLNGERPVLSGDLVEGSFPNFERLLSEDNDKDYEYKIVINGINATKLAKVSKLITSNKYQSYNPERHGNVFTITFSDRADFVAICCGYNVDESRTANYSRVRTILKPLESLGS